MICRNRPAAAGSGRSLLRRTFRAAPVAGGLLVRFFLRRPRREDVSNPSSRTCIRLGERWPLAVAKVVSASAKPLQSGSGASGRVSGRAKRKRREAAPISAPRALIPGTAAFRRLDLRRSARRRAYRLAQRGPPACRRSRNSNCKVPKRRSSITQRVAPTCHAGMGFCAQPKGGGARTERPREEPREARRALRGERHGQKWRGGCGGGNVGRKSETRRGRFGTTACGSKKRSGRPAHETFRAVRGERAARGVYRRGLAGAGS